MKTNRNKKKLILRKQLDVLGHDLPFTKLDDIIQWLSETNRQLKEKGYFDITLNTEFTGSDSPYELVINGSHEETDKEFDERMKKVDAEKEAEKNAYQKHVKAITLEAKRLGIIK